MGMNMLDGRWHNSEETHTKFYEANGDHMFLKGTLGVGWLVLGDFFLEMNRSDVLKRYYLEMFTLG